MIISLKEYIKNKDKYSSYDQRFITVNLKTKNKMDKFLKFNVRELTAPVKVSGKEYVMPSYIKTEGLKIKFTKDYPNATVDNFEVEIDELRDTIEKSKGDNIIKLKSSQYINIDDYVITEKQHWLNSEVIAFYKELNKRSVLYTQDIQKTKKIFKLICNNEGVPIDYKKLLQLFKLTGVSDESFRKFIKEGRY